MNVMDDMDSIDCPYSPYRPCVHLSRRILCFLFPVIVLLGMVVFAQTLDRKVLFRDEFNDLSNWGPLYFPKIKRHSSYTVDSKGEEHCLKCESKNSASVIVFEKTFDVYEFPELRWRWKVENIYKKGDGRTKQGDDYSLRIYIIFSFDSDKGGFWGNMKYNVAEALYGDDPPQSSLSYIWANRRHAKQILPNACTDRSQMIILQHGTEKVGRWQTERVNVLDDYKRAFGEPPSHQARIAIMNDSDNTGESSVSYIDFIEIFNEEPQE